MFSFAAVWTQAEHLAQSKQRERNCRSQRDEWMRIRFSDVP